MQVHFKFYALYQLIVVLVLDLIIFATNECTSALIWLWIHHMWAIWRCVDARTTKLLNTHATRITIQTSIFGSWTTTVIPLISATTLTMTASIIRRLSGVVFLLPMPQMSAFLSTSQLSRDCTGLNVMHAKRV
jgi:hypothetical protein